VRLLQTQAGIGRQAGINCQFIRLVRENLVIQEYGRRLVAPATELAKAVIPGGLQQPRFHIKGIQLGQVIPETQQHFLRGVLGIGLVRQQGPRKAVNIIAMPLAKNPEFDLAYHVTVYNTQRG